MRPKPQRETDQIRERSKTRSPGKAVGSGRLMVNAGLRDEGRTIVTMGCFARLIGAMARIVRPRDVRPLRNERVVAVDVPRP
jgi:hypothetical protein